GKQKDPFDFFKWFLTVAIIHAVLLVPKVDVVVIDRTSTSPPTVRANIPVGFAFFASVTSSVGDWLTRTFETVFAMPND
ncbi:conjugal transfer protein TraG N-terminal domain-containing protein, partial [Streptococcus pyogenes]